MAESSGCDFKKEIQIPFDNNITMVILKYLSFASFYWAIIISLKKKISK